MAFSIFSRTYSYLKRSKRLSQVLVLISFLTTFAVVRVTADLNMFVVVDSFTENIVSQTLGVSFEENIAKREGIIMRKEILPLIKAFLEASS